MYPENSASRSTYTGADLLASGKAKFESRRDRMRFSAESEDLSVATRVDVFANGTFVESAAVNAFGTADLNLDSRDGDTVPMRESGDTVEVRDSATGELLLSGVLGNK